MEPESFQAARKVIRFLHPLRARRRLARWCRRMATRVRLRFCSPERKEKLLWRFPLLARQRAILKRTRLRIFFFGKHPILTDFLQDECPAFLTECIPRSFEERVYQTLVKQSAFSSDSLCCLTDGKRTCLVRTWPSRDNTSRPFPMSAAITPGGLKGAPAIQFCLSRLEQIKQIFDEEASIVERETDQEIRRQLKKPGLSRLLAKVHASAANWRRELSELPGSQAQWGAESPCLRLAQLSGLATPAARAMLAAVIDVARNRRLPLTRGRRPGIILPRFFSTPEVAIQSWPQILRQAGCARPALITIADNSSPQVQVLRWQSPTAISNGADSPAPDNQRLPPSLPVSVASLDLSWKLLSSPESPAKRRHPAGRIFIAALQVARWRLRKLARRSLRSVRNLVQLLRERITRPRKQKAG